VGRSAEEASDEAQRHERESHRGASTMVELAAEGLPFDVR
jgi:hypothetical protein